MPRSPWEIVLWVLVVVFPWLLVRAGRRRDLAFLAVMWGILCASAQVLANPAGERHEAVIACGVLLALDLAAWLMPETVEIRLAQAGEEQGGQAVAGFPRVRARSGGTRRARLPAADGLACAQVSSGDPDSLACRARRLAAGDDHRRREPRARPGAALAAGDAQSVQRPAIQGPDGRDSQASRRVSRDVLRRFADRRAAARGLAFLAAPAARRAADRAGAPIRGLERGRGRILIAPGRAAIPAGSRPLSTRPRPGLVRLERRGRGHRPAGQDVQDPPMARGRVPAGAGALSGLSCAHVLHAKVASRAAGGRAGPGFTAGQRRRTTWPTWSDSEPRPPAGASRSRF